MKTVVRRKSTIPGPEKSIVSSMMEELKKFVGRLGETDCDMPDTWRDPLSHPAIRAMSARELADLPFAAGYGRRPGR